MKIAGRKMGYYFIHVCLFFFILFFLSKPVYAQNLTVTSESTPLFSETFDNTFFPGKIVTKKVTVKNNSSETKLIRVSATNKSENNSDFSNVLKFQINDNFGNTLYGENPQKHLSDFYSENEYPLTFLLPGNSVIYDFTVTLDTSSDNTSQNKKTGFDLSVGFSEENNAPTNTPTPSATNGTSTNTNTTVLTDESGPSSTPTSVSNNTTPATLGINTFIPVTYRDKTINVPVLGAETSSASSTIRFFLFLIFLFLLIIFFILIKNKKSKTAS